MGSMRPFKKKACAMCDIILWAVCVDFKKACVMCNRLVF